MGHVGVVSKLVMFHISSAYLPRWRAFKRAGHATTRKDIAGLDSWFKQREKSRNDWVHEEQSRGV